jgi:predicted nucleic acid-binding protein
VTSLAVARRGIFLDTSALYDVIDSSAQRHEQVAAELEALMRSNVALLITDAVLSEFHGLALGRLGPAIAFDAVDRLVASPRVALVATGPGAIRTALDFLRERPGRRLSLVDALSFGAMRDLELDSALTLDADFAAEGFRMRP